MDFTFDGAFLVVIKAVSGESGFTRYQSAVPFAGGAAFLDYGNMEGAPEPEPEVPVTVVCTVRFDLAYTGAPAPEERQVAAGGLAASPSPAPRRNGRASPSSAEYDRALVR